MYDFAVKPNYKGHDYLSVIFKECIADNNYHQKSITHEIYPSVARQFNTTVNGVIKCIKTAIKRSYEEVPERYKDFFGRELKKEPTNSEFISMVSEYLVNSTI